MSVNSKKVLVACGCAIATSTAIAEKIKRLAEKNNIPIKVDLCRAVEVPSKSLTFKPDLVVVSTKTPPPADSSVPYLKGIAYLTGIGEDKLNAEVLKVLRS